MQCILRHFAQTKSTLRWRTWQTNSQFQGICPSSRLPKAVSRAGLVGKLLSYTSIISAFPIPAARCSYLMVRVAQPATPPYPGDVQPIFPVESAGTIVTN